MVHKIIGVDEKGKKIFEREAREYDQGIMGQIIPGLTVGDIIKTVPILFAIGAGWANFNNQYLQQQQTNQQMLAALKSISDEVGKHSKILAHLDSYLSSSTGKQFNDGEPIK
jgi:hypothetical protein